MNRIEIGEQFEREAESILLKNGYNIVEHTSLKHRFSHYDFHVKKNNVNYYVEVRGKNGKYDYYFGFSKRKLHHLQDLNEKVILLLINKQGHFFIPLENIRDFSNKLFKVNNIIIHISETRKKSGRKILKGKITIRVWKAKKNGQKLITIPKYCEIKEGDYIEIKKV